MENNSLRPFYFTVIFWGEVYRRYFLDLLLASLLSPNNIPALNPARKSKFLIVTTRADWDALQSEPLFQQMMWYVEPVWFEMPFPRGDEPKMLVMSKGHKLVSMKAFDDRAYGVFVTPDLVLSDGSVAAMARLAEAGKKVVLSVAIRYAQEALLEEMERGGYLKPGQPLVLPARDLMRMALQHLHTETLRYEFDAPYFTDYPISVYWWVPNGNGMIIHSFSWAPLVVDYGAIHDHDTSTFEEWTLDGDYIYRNFPSPNDVHVITDSDEIVLVSFTSEKDLHFELCGSSKEQWKSRILLEKTKVDWIRSIRNSSVMDPLKRAIFKQPVYLHSTDLGTAWQCRRLETDRIIARAHRNDLEGRFLSDVFLHSGTGQSRVSDWVIRHYNNETAIRDVSWWLVILYWLMIIKPVRTVRSFWNKILARPRWLWRYRRYVWWELKEKLGLVEERNYHWMNGGWEGPGISLVCPFFTIWWLWRSRDWLWRYRRFVWWKIKARLGLVKGLNLSGPGPEWEGPGVDLICPIFTAQWLWRSRQWLWRYRRFVWWRLKEKVGIVEECHFDWRIGGWDAPSISLVCPVFTIRWLWRQRASLLKELRPGGGGIRGAANLVWTGGSKIVQDATPVPDVPSSYAAKSSKHT
jgi:hypothetical protein